MLSSFEESVLLFIFEHLQQHGRPPTQSEIARALGVSSRGRIDRSLVKLTAKGLIARDYNVSRGLRLTRKGRQEIGAAVSTLAKASSRLVRVPLLGNIVAGEPIEVGNTDFSTYDEEDAIELSSIMLSGKTNDLFALRVSGDSMIDAMVNDGDVVIMRRQEVARNGEMVAVWLTSSDTTTLKYFHHEGNRIRLQPANPTMEPIHVDPKDVRVQGKVELIIRQVPRLDYWCLDAAVQEQVQVGRAFDLAVLVRPSSAPRINIHDLERVYSEDVLPVWPETETCIRLRIEVRAPECQIHGTNQCSIRLYRNHYRPVFFHLTARTTGLISIHVLVFQEIDVLGNARVHTESCEQKIGSIRMEFASHELSKEPLPVKPSSPLASGPIDPAQLARQLDEYFSEADLQELCYDLGIDYESLPGPVKKGKARELVEHCRRRGTHLALRQRCAELRPHVAW